MDRKEAFMAAMEPILPEQFSKSSRCITSHCEKHSKEIVHTFLKAFNAVIERTTILQDEKKKGKVKYILFSHLYSSMYLQQYLIRIDAMDPAFYNDPLMPCLIGMPDIYMSFSRRMWKQSGKNLVKIFPESVNMKLIIYAMRMRRIIIV